MTPPQFTARIAGSYVRPEWKKSIHGLLLQAHADAPAPGPVGLDFAITTAPDRNWVNIWRPLLDSFGPVLGEDPSKPFHPNDDRIVSLGLHHHVKTGIGHDVIIAAWWKRL